MHQRRLARGVDLNSGARGVDGIASQRWTSEAVAARFAEVAADLALSRRERNSLADRVRALEGEKRALEAEARQREGEATQTGKRSARLPERARTRAGAYCRMRGDYSRHEEAPHVAAHRPVTGPPRWWRRPTARTPSQEAAAAAARLEGGLSFGSACRRRARGNRPKRASARRRRGPEVGTATEALDPFDALRARLIGEIAHPGRSVTIVIPCFNYGQYVKEAVDSALNQTYPFCDVVLVDDGSTDAATVEACQSLASDRLIVLRQANQGLSAARNNGAALTDSEFLMFLDADDRLHPDAVLFMLWSLLRHPNSAYVYCSQRFFGDENVVWEPQAFNGYDLLFANHPSVCSLIRRSAYDDAHGYSPGHGG